jgi:hypothetical protein
MTTIINNTLAGQLPTTAQQLKEYKDHCESTIEDCNNTLQDHEVADYDKKNYREMRYMARLAMSQLKKVQL